MMTQTHTLIAASLLTSSQRSVGQNVAILLGSLIPDLAIYILFVWSKIMRIPERELWREVYFSEPMLTVTAIGNSFPLYLMILVIGMFLVKHSNLNHHKAFSKQPSYKSEAAFYSKTLDSYWHIITQSVICLFALSAVTHLLGDFPVHVSDAHPHFWPVSDWRFHSVVSYWDKNHYGSVFSLFEAALGILLSIILFKRYQARWVRGLTILAIIAYAAVPAYFAFKL